MDKSGAHKKKLLNVNPARSISGTKLNEKKRGEKENETTELDSNKLNSYEWMVFVCRSC